jgi:hypothetical protein
MPEAEAEAKAAPALNRAWVVEPVGPLGHTIA